MKHSPQSLIAKNIQPHNTRDICDTDFSSFRSFENFDKFESFERFKSCESLNTAKGKRKLIARHLSIRHFIISISNGGGRFYFNDSLLPQKVWHQDGYVDEYAGMDITVWVLRLWRSLTVWLCLAAYVDDRLRLRIRLFQYFRVSFR